MLRLKAITEAKIAGTRNAWQIAERNVEIDVPTRSCRVELEIQGYPKNGYHLVMSPSGFFTADYWYETEAEARAEARSLFGVEEADWSSSEES